jgi:hypothetical protein
VRSTAFLVDRLEAAIVEAQRLVQLAEASSVFTYNNRLHVYEAAFLLIFSAWEGFLEEVMIRFIAGYGNTSGKMVFKPGKVLQSNLVQAKTALFNGRAYLLWHSPDKPIARSQDWFNSGAVESVISSAQTDIAHFAAIRHYVAHRTHDCEVKFNAAALALAGVVVAGSRAGRFLRQRTIDPVSGVDVTWIARISDDLIRYAKQIAD